MRTSQDFYDFVKTIQDVFTEIETRLALNDIRSACAAAHETRKAMESALAFADAYHNKIN